MLHLLASIPQLAEHEMLNRPSIVNSRSLRYYRPRS